MGVRDKFLQISDGAGATLQLTNLQPTRRIRNRSLMLLIPHERTSVPECGIG
jgi:hypothetical protein